MIKAKFNVEFLEGAVEFLASINKKAAEKIIYNIDKSKYLNDPKLFKKLTNHIWEFRTEYSSINYRLLAFWDKSDIENILVITSNGFIKKKDKVLTSEINKSEQLRKTYFNIK